MTDITFIPSNLGLYNFKIVLIGDAGVGKTSLINRYVFNEFSTDYKASIGSNIVVKDIIMDNEIKIKLIIWDIAGHQKWEVMRPFYYRGVNGIIIVYDVTNIASYNNLFIQWYPEIAAIKENYKCIILGNKSDLEDLQIEKDEKLREKFNPINILKTSALNGENVRQAFIELTEFIFKDKINEEKNLLKKQ